MTISDTITAAADTAPSVLRVATVATSLSPASVSSAGLRFVEAALERAGAVCNRVNVVDLGWAFPGDLLPGPWKSAAETVKAADAVVFALGIHGWASSGVAKVTAELLGRALEGKPVAFVCGMGSNRSHLAHAGLANSLVFERAVLWVPTGLQLTEDTVGTPECLDRAVLVAEQLLDLARRLVKA